MQYVNSAPLSNIRNGKTISLQMTHFASSRLGGIRLRSHLIVGHTQSEEIRENVVELRAQAPVDSLLRQEPRQRGNAYPGTLRLLCLVDDAAPARYRCDAVDEERRPLTQIKTSFATTYNSLEG